MAMPVARSKPPSEARVREQHQAMRDQQLGGLHGLLHCPCGCLSLCLCACMCLKAPVLALLASFGGSIAHAADTVCVIQHWWRIAVCAADVCSCASVTVCHTDRKKHIIVPS